MLASLYYVFLHISYLKDIFLLMTVDTVGRMVASSIFALARIAQIQR